MKILFWNTYNNVKINDYIVNLVEENDVDVLVAAEYKADKDELNVMLHQLDLQLEECNTFGCERIDIWSNYINVEPGLQTKYYSIQIINDEIILCCVHLPSDLHGNKSEERLIIVQQIIDEIESLSKLLKTEKIVIIGDMNEMPYSRGCLNANGFHGLPALSETDAPSRTVIGKEYKKYYNPMWSLMGDFSYPPGTYYWSNAQINNPMWHMMDQVIISKDLLPLFRKEELKIITETKKSKLYNRNGHPNSNISDHFPIICYITDDY